jgi:hypothetical protein
VRDADRGRGGVVEAADRLEVLGHRVASERLHDHHRAVVGERLVGMACRPDRVAQVMQAVEEAVRS